MTLTDVETALNNAQSIGDRLVALVSLRKKALTTKQTAFNDWKSGKITEDECEAVQDYTTAVLSLITNHRIGTEALIQ